MVVSTDEPRLPAPTPLRRVKNTIRCQTAFCGVPLLEITVDHHYIPLHARSSSRLVNGRNLHTLTCPNCGKVRTIEQR